MVLCRHVSKAVKTRDYRYDVALLPLNNPNGPYRGRDYPIYYRYDGKRISRIYARNEILSFVANGLESSTGNIRKPYRCPSKVQYELRHVVLPSGCSLSTRHGLMTVTALLT